MTDAVQIGDPLPDIALNGPNGPVPLRNLADGSPLLVLFYEEDATPTCAAQLGSFRDDWDMICELDAVVVAISADGLESHQRFADEQGLPFILFSDPDLDAADAFGVVDHDAGRSRRAAFVADGHGRVTLAIPFYQPANFDHYQAVFEALGLDV